MKILNKILGKEPQEPKAEMVYYLTKELVTSFNISIDFIISP